MCPASIIGSGVVKHARIMVTGISGVGKSHLIDGVKDSGTFSVFEFGRSMDRHLKKVTGRTDLLLATLPLSSRQEIQKRILRELETAADDSPVIIDGHLLVEQGGTSLTVPGVPGDQYHRLDLDGIVLVTDDASRIKERREKNHQKYGNLNNEQTHIQELQRMYLQVTTTYSILFGCFLSQFDLRQFQNLDQDPVWVKPRQKLGEIIVEISRSISGAQ